MKWLYRLGVEGMPESLRGDNPECGNQSLQEGYDSITARSLRHIEYECPIQGV